MTLRARATRSAVPLAGAILLLCLTGAVLISIFSPVAVAAHKARGQAKVQTAPASSAPAGEEASGAGTPEGSTGGPEAQGGEGATRKDRRAARKRERERARTKQPAAQSPEQTGGGEEEPESGLTAQTQAQPQTKAQARSKRRKEKEREHRRALRTGAGNKEAGGGEPEAGGEEGAPEATGGGTSTASAPLATSGATATAAKSPSTGTLPAVLGVSATRSSRGLTAARSTRAGHGARISPALAGARALPVAAKQPVPSAPRSGAGKGRGAAAQTPGVRRSSPLVRTVTQIIDVVPGFVRIVIVGLLGIALLLAIESRISTRQAERLASQRRELLDDVGLLQAALLPVLPESFDGVSTTAAYRPASGPAAGGDFYDVFALEDGRVAVIVGDVSGHGRKALPHTTLVRFTLRAYIEAGMSPRGALKTAAPVLERQLGGSFATVVLAIYDPAHRSLVYSCAGHPPPVFDSAGAKPITACSAPPIGVGWPTGTRQTEVSVPGAACACFYTDGVIEAKLDGELFGAARLEGILAALGARDGAEELLERVAAVADEHPDDMAACLLGLAGDERSPSIAVEEVEVDRHELGGPRLKRFLAGGGLSPPEIEGVLAQAETAVRRDGSVVLRLHPGEGRTRIELAHDNSARMRITARAHAGATEVAV